VANLSLLLARHRRSSARGNRLTEMPHVDILLLSYIVVRFLLYKNSGTFLTLI